MTVLRFVRTRFPAAYALYAVLWAAAADAGAHMLGANTPWRPSWAVAVQILVLLMAALALRMVDDLKDLPHDRIHHPERPVPSGQITPQALSAAAIVLAVSGFFMTGAVFGIPAVAALTGAFALGLLHWWLVASGRELSQRPLLEMVTTYPIQILLSLFVFAATAARLDLPHWPRLGWLLLTFAGAFLHFEISRKTRRPAVGVDMAGMYTASLSVTACASLIMGLAAVGVISWVGAAYAVGMHAPWLVLTGLVLLVLPAVAVAPLVRRRRDTPRSWPSAVFIIGLYLLIMVSAGRFEPL